MGCTPGTSWFVSEPPCCVVVRLLPGWGCGEVRPRWRVAGELVGIGFRVVPSVCTSCSQAKAIIHHPSLPFGVSLAHEGQGLLRGPSHVTTTCPVKCVAFDPAIGEAALRPHGQGDHEMSNSIEGIF